MPSAEQHAVEPSGEVYRVFGSVMHVVQTWELALAVLWWRTGTPAGDRREAESTASKKAVDRLEKAFTRVTASQARKELEADLPLELLDLIGDLLADRNRLAHRFLRERQEVGGFKPGTLAWLGDAGYRFDASIQALFERMVAFGQYEGEIRAHWPAVANALASNLFAGEPVDFECALREASDAPDAG